MKRIAVPLVGIALALIVLVAWQSVFADAGNPILGTIRGTIVPDGSGTGVTVYVRGQWNWYSHGGDCNQTAVSGDSEGDRAGTGVGIIWNDPNGRTAGTSEVQSVTITGSPTGGTFKLKFSGQTTGTIVFNASALVVDSALEALSNIGAGDVNVSGGPGPGTPWTVNFTGALAETNVAQMTLANKSFTGGTSPNVVIATTTPGVNGEAFNGYKYTASGFTVYLGVKNAGFGNLVDGLVHPVDRGDRPENYDTSGSDYPAAQAFVDPAPVAAGSVTSTQQNAWKAGCGRIPITATAGPKTGSNAESTNTTCGDGTLTCNGEPWGSWGYEKNSALGYSHHYAKRSDVTIICANFYDVHGTNQVPSGTGSIDVLANGDNSVKTNAFNPSQGANCISFPACVISPFKTADADEVDYGSDVGYTIGADTDPNGGGCDHLTLHDDLPGAPAGGLDWFEDPDVTECDITGSLGSEDLDCDFGAVAAGGHVEVHVSSHTDKTTADCPGTRTLSNTVTLHDPNQPDPTTDPSAGPVTIKVHCPSTTLEKGVDAASDVQITASYTYRETNNGDVPLDDVAVTDDQCSPVVVDGDTDGDGVLDSGETWTGDTTANGVLDPAEEWVFKCTHTYTMTTNPQDFTNTAIGSGTSPLGHVVTVCGTTPAAGTICNADETDSTTISVNITVGGP